VVEQRKGQGQSETSIYTKIRVEPMAISPRAQSFCIQTLFRPARILAQYCVDLIHSSTLKKRPQGQRRGNDNEN
jgi:hypothetical protein